MSSGTINDLWEEYLWPVEMEENDLEGIEDRNDKNCNHGSLRLNPRIGDSSSDGGLRHLHQSAPVNVLDWSKILGVGHLKEQNPDADDFDMAGHEEEERLPPHEYLAREHDRCRNFNISSGWLGVGLKGREMSRVRNAVWRQTGFLG